jgi:MFS family permease
MTRRVPLVGWLAAEVVSLCGTRLSMIAIPWFVLTTTGSATMTGLVAFAEMGPYVVAKALGGPLIDRLGARRISVLADAASAGVVVAVPLLHLAGLLHVPVLVAVVALAGVLRGPGDGAKAALVPDVVDASGVPMERATGLHGVAERLASTAGAALAGLLVAVLGPVNALLLDAGSFAVSAALIAVTAPRRAQVTGAPPEKDADGYVAQLRAGWDFLRRDPVLVAMTVMVSLTNLLDQAYVVVLVPFWAHDSGHGASLVGLLFATFAAAATLGSLVASAWAHRLPRFATYLVAFLVAGAPRFMVLALDVPLAAVLVTGAAAGFASGFVNPILGAVVFERIPRHLVGRVSSLNTSLCWAGIPFGGLVGGACIAAAGLSPALLLLGGAYLAATMLPAVQPSWRTIDSARSPASRPSTPVTSG